MRVYYAAVLLLFATQQSRKHFFLVTAGESVPCVCRHAGIDYSIAVLVSCLGHFGPRLSDFD